MLTLFQNGLQAKSGFEMCVLPQHFMCWSVLVAKHVSNPELKQFNHIYVCYRYGNTGKRASSEDGQPSSHPSDTTTPHRASSAPTEARRPDAAPVPVDVAALNTRVKKYHKAAYVLLWHVFCTRPTV